MQSLWQTWKRFEKSAYDLWLRMRYLVFSMTRSFPSISTLGAPHKSTLLKYVNARTTFEARRKSFSSGIRPPSTARRSCCPA